jgi:hypothetical protein
MVFKPPAAPPYATRVPHRHAGEFRTHSTLGQAKQAVTMYSKWSGGVALFDMEVLRLDSHQDEYVTWIAIKEGDLFKDHPQIHPQVPDEGGPYLALRAAARLAGISEDKLSGYVKGGTLKAYRLGSLTQYKRTDLLELKEDLAAPGETEAAASIVEFYDGQPAPLPDGVAPASPEELETADEFALKIVECPDTEALLSEDPHKPDAKVVMCGTLPGLCQVDEDFDSGEPTEGEREFPVYSEAELDEAFDVAADDVPEPNERTREAIQRLETIVERAPLPQDLRAQAAAALRKARKEFLERLDAARNPSDAVRVDKVCRLLSEAYQLTAGLRMDLHPDPPEGPLPDLYPLTVLRARYSGTYEGGKWVAFKDKPDIVADATGDDLTCASFFRLYGSLKPIGRGDSPEAAIRDLDRQFSS